MFTKTFIISWQN